ncbi:MAG TPA: hypothetical protein VKY92_10700 [Verrucomicrobiae bacterium]|nr:hypothetical protein [Verrucomicrobiae bacterium]
MWDLLEVLLVIVFDLPLDFIDLTRIWRFLVALAGSIALAAIISWALDGKDFQLPAAVLATGAAAGVFWEICSRIK